MSRKDDDAYLFDMLAAARTVQEFAWGKKLEDYIADAMLRSAIERQIEIIGEAGRNVSRDYQQRHPEVPWQKIAAQRHVLAHEYDDIQHDLIWRVITIHLPVLIQQLEPLVPPTAEDGTN